MTHNCSFLFLYIFLIVQMKTPCRHHCWPGDPEVSRHFFYWIERSEIYLVLGSQRHFGQILQEWFAIFTFWGILGRFSEFQEFLCSNFLQSQNFSIWTGRLVHIFIYINLHIHTIFYIIYYYKPSKQLSIWASCTLDTLSLPSG